MAKCAHCRQRRPLVRSGLYCDMCAGGVPAGRHRSELNTGPCLVWSVALVLVGVTGLWFGVWLTI